MVSFKINSNQVKANLDKFCAGLPSVVLDLVKEAAEQGAEKARNTTLFKNTGSTDSIRNHIEVKQVNQYSYSVTANAYYAGYLEYGTSPHTITAVNKSALHWIDSNGRERFAKSVNHPGNSARPFMAEAEQYAQDWLEYNTAFRIQSFIGSILA